MSRTIAKEFQPSRLPALIDAYARLDGRDYSTIQNIARTIREAGLIPTTKRGSGASTMSHREVVNLILGANGSETAAGAPKAVEQLRRMGCFRPQVPGLYEIDQSNPERINLNGIEICRKARTHLASTIWAPLVSDQVPELGDACDWLVENAHSIDAEITRRNLARVVGNMVSKPSGISKEDRDAIARGSIPTWILEYASHWSGVAKVRLTISRYGATFEAISRLLQGFPCVRLEYSVGTLESDRLEASLMRRVSIEIDFRLILELSSLVVEKKELRAFTSSED